MTPARTRRSGVVIPRRLTWSRRLAANLIAFGCWLLLKSWRIVWADKEHSGTRAPVIYCIWHDRLVFALASYDDYAKKKRGEKGLVAMVSASGDGALLSAVLGKFGIRAIRGSSSKRGPQALLEAARWLEQGYSIAITPDGPRGPSHQISDGVIYLAQLSGRPIITVFGHTPWKIRLRSWDRFQIPLPFARCELGDGHAFHVPREITDEERQRLKSQLQESMLAIMRD